MPTKKKPARKPVSKPVKKKPASTSSTATASKPKRGGYRFTSSSNYENNSPKNVYVNNSIPYGYRYTASKPSTTTYNAYRPSYSAPITYSQPQQPQPQPTKRKWYQRVTDTVKPWFSRRPVTGNASGKH